MLLRIADLIIISLMFLMVNFAFGARVEAASNETLTPTPKPTAPADIDLRLAPGCLLPSWTGLCKRATTPTPKASPTVTPTPTNTQTVNDTQKNMPAGVDSQGGTVQPPEVIGVQTPTVQPKSGPEGMLIVLFGMLPFGIWLCRKYNNLKPKKTLTKSFDYA